MNTKAQTAINNLVGNNDVNNSAAYLRDYITNLEAALEDAINALTNAQGEWACVSLEYAPENIQVNIQFLREAEEAARSTVSGRTTI